MSRAFFCRPLDSLHEHLLGLEIVGCHLAIRVTQTLDALGGAQGKGGDQRIVGLDEGALLYLEHWINRRQKLGLPPKGNVFVQFEPPRDVPIDVKGSRAI